MLKEVEEDPNYSKKQRQLCKDNLNTERQARL